MATNLAWFLFAATLFLVLFTGVMWWIWGRVPALFGGAIYFCILTAGFLLAQVWNTELLWWVRVAVSIFTVVGIIAVAAAIVGFLVNEHLLSWRPTHLPCDDEVIDITKPLPIGGEWR